MNIHDYNFCNRISVITFTADLEIAFVIIFQIQLRSSIAKIPLWNTKFLMSILSEAVSIF